MLNNVLLVSAVQQCESVYIYPLPPELPSNPFSSFLSAQLVGFPGGASGKESACQCRRCRRCGFDPFVGKIPGRRKWQPTPVFLPGKSRGQRSLAGYSPEVAKESDVPEHTRTVGFSTFSLS